MSTSECSPEQDDVSLDSLDESPSSTHSPNVPRHMPGDREDRERLEAQRHTLAARFMGAVDGFLPEHDWLVARPSQDRSQAAQRPPPPPSPQSPQQQINRLFGAPTGYAVAQQTQFPQGTPHAPVHQAPPTAHSYHDPRMRRAGDQVGRSSHQQQYSMPLSHTGGPAEVTAPSASAADQQPWMFVSHHGQVMVRRVQPPVQRVTEQAMAFPPRTDASMQYGNQNPGLANRMPQNVSRAGSQAMGIGHHAGPVASTRGRGGGYVPNGQPQQASTAKSVWS